MVVIRVVVSVQSGARRSVLPMLKVSMDIGSVHDPLLQDVVIEGFSFVMAELRDLLEEPCLCSGGGSFEAEVY